jgi:hypothetical protein
MLAPLRRNSARLFATLLSVALLTGCPGVRLGGGPLNEPPPSTGVATPIGEPSPFFSENGASVGGNAQLYQLNSGAGFILRLSGISAPSENGLLVVVFDNNGTQLLRTGLKSITGNQNYTIAVTGSPGWGWVAIFSPQFNWDYAKAQL